MTTSRVRPIAQSLPLACSRLALMLAAGLAIGAGVSMAAAQQAPAVTGSIRTSDGLRPLPSARARDVSRQTAQNETTSNVNRQQYQPISEGALPDAPETVLDGYVADDNSPVPSTSDALAPLPDSPPASAQANDNSGETGTQTPKTKSGKNSQANGKRATSTAASSGDETADLTTGTVRAGSVDSLDEERNLPASADAERVTAIEGLTRNPEEAPFSATGIKVGSFILRPTLDQGIEWTSNAQSTAGGNSDFLSQTRLRLNADSDWSRHSASLSLDGTYSTSITGSGYSEFSGNADAAVGLDIGDELRINGAAGYQRGLEDATSPTVLTGTLSRPLRQTLTGSVGAEKYAGKLRAALTGKVARDIYGDATLSTGGTVSQADRNNTLYSATLRGGYEISPALVPFAELEYGRRLYDQRLDASGYQRSANRYGARAGVEFDMGEKLNGEVSAGWITEKVDDSRLAAISAFTVNGDIAWSPIRGTIVDLSGGTEIEGSTIAGESGSVLYNASVSATRNLRENLTGKALVGASFRRYAASTDRDTTVSGELSLTWWLNRYAGITGRARHELVTSNVAGRDSNTTSVYLGLTLQR